MTFKKRFNRNQLSVTQNFLVNQIALQKVIEYSKILNSDIVIDIGAGKGVITELLSKIAETVIAIEPDTKLYAILEQEFKKNSKVSLSNKKIENFQFPTKPYKTVSNIPFRITSAIIKQLSADKNFQGGTLILQEEAAHKFAGEQLSKPNTMYSVLHGVNFEYSRIYDFKTSDFSPAPQVKIIAMRISRRNTPLVDKIGLFSDLVAFVFNKSVPNIGALKTLISAKELASIGISSTARPSELKIKQYVAIFAFLEKTPRLAKIANYYNKILSEQSQLQKNFRTRVAKDWKKSGKML